MASSVKMAMQARKAKGMADDLAAQAGDAGGASSSGAKASKTAAKSVAGEDNLEDDSGAEEVLDGQTSSKIKGEKNKIEVSDFFDDLMEGFAELWRLAVAGGHSFASCVRRVAYPLKESAVQAMDSLNETASGRRTAAPVAPTFVHH
mmetsp:Transcript_11325/g.21341  ORF Transcript_11325/g.21341 Transcript_11325/m.21341 type:complete len:147 (+) Transcript_11325:77-517(+)